MILALVTFLHIAALLVWCAALVLLPFLLRLHGRATDGPVSQSAFTRMRLLSHAGYTLVATPAAVIAVAAGTGLIFLDQVFEPWLLLKLAFVSGMVLVHAWLGHLVLLSGEKGPDWAMPPPVIALLLALPLMAAVLWLVLAKPQLSALEAALPLWALEPRGIAPEELLPEGLLPDGVMPGAPAQGAVP
ncbi:CopD family protein [Pseudogemmobacter sonorensis]|uniref:CopD family protein n=1 Tax=Pseudogemmobacter sonorensis TaxID=2989681 RepID=UPI0036B5DDF6